MGQFTINFWNITYPNSTPLEQLISEMAQRPHAERVRTVSTGFVLLREARQLGQAWEGDFMHIHGDGFPFRVSSEGDIGSLDLADNEGIGFSNAFLYYPPTRTLVYQYNQSGMSAGKAMEYLLHHSGIPVKPKLKPIMQASAIDRLRHSLEVTRADIQFANLSDSELYVDAENELTGGAIKYHQRYNAPIVSMNFSTGTKRTALGRLIRTDLVALLTGKSQSAGILTKCKVSMKEEVDGETRVLDLLKNKIVDQGAVEAADRNEASYFLRAGELRKAWERNGEQIIRTLSKEP